MKTLNEVIKAMEDAPLGEFSEVEIDYATVEDALHYLKKYRDEDKKLGQAINEACDVEMQYCKLIEDFERNEPLDWDELRQMLGKPVWMEWNECKGWRLVNCFDSVTTGKKAVALTDRFGVDFVFDEETIVKCEVKVYRKERDENAGRSDKYF